MLIWYRIISFSILFTPCFKWQWCVLVSAGGRWSKNKGNSGLDGFLKQLSRATAWGRKRRVQSRGRRVRADGKEWAYVERWDECVWKPSQETPCCPTRLPSAYSSTSGSSSSNIWKYLLESFLQIRWHQKMASLLSGFLRSRKWFSYEVFILPLWPAKLRALLIPGNAVSSLTSPGTGGNNY